MPRIPRHKTTEPSPCLLVGMKMGLPQIVFQNDLTKDKDDAFWVQYGIDLAEQGR